MGALDPSVDGVQALLPMLTIGQTVGTTLKVPNVAQVQIELFNQEAAVLARLGDPSGWPAVQVTPTGPVGVRADLVTIARSVVEYRAAAYVYDATYPAREDASTGRRYGELLWSRADENLNLLVLRLGVNDSVPDVVPDDEQVDAMAGAAALFPPPMFVRSQRW